MTPATMIRTARHRAHLTQAALAARLGVAEGTVRRWESGRDFPASWLPRVAEVCGVEIGIVVPPRDHRSLRAQLVEWATATEGRAACAAYTHAVELLDAWAIEVPRAE